MVDLPWNPTLIDLISTGDISVSLPLYRRGPYKGRSGYSKWYERYSILGIVPEKYRKEQAHRDYGLSGSKMRKAEVNAKHRMIAGVAERLKIERLGVPVPFGPRYHSPRTGNRSGMTGITFKTNNTRRWGWDVRVEYLGIRANIGKYSDMFEAAAAYDLYVSQCLRPLGCRAALNYEQGKVSKNHLCEHWIDFDDSWDFPTIANMPGPRPAVVATPILRGVSSDTPDLSHYSLYSYGIEPFPSLQI